MYSRLRALHYPLISILALACVTAHAETIHPIGLSSLKELHLADGDSVHAQRLLITDRTGATVVDTDKALPRIENAYSPDRYDAYIADLFPERQGKSTVTDPQGERHIMLSSSTQAGDYLLLITREEGNGVYNFNLKFRYDGTSKSFELVHILLNENNAECDQSLLSTYVIDKKALGITSITSFDGTLAFRALRAFRLAHQTSINTAEKLMPEAAARNFDDALKAYKTGNKEQLKTLVNYFISGDEDGNCAPENYIVEKYYFPQKIGWSNDLGFLFEQAGHYPEAVELLKHITQKHPNRAVAYINLADAYWAMGEQEKARKAYNQYYDKMVSDQKQGRIPQRVIARK